MNIKTAFPSNYITHEDLQAQDVPVQIAGCRMEPVKQDTGPDKDKPVLYFAGHQRGLVLNVTNAMAIASLYGDETDAWRGQWITLYPTQCQFGARMVDCIRVRPFPPQHANGQPAFNQQPQPQPFAQQQLMLQPAPPQFLPPQPLPPPAGQQTSLFDQQQQQPHAGQQPVQF
jgi:hypothetical protein